MVRVRFAPSPTGELHLGGARTALYNYLFARKNKGQFIIRLEDTDRERLVEGSLERLLSGLKWLGLNWDEGPDIGGPYEPYIQSQRLAHYQHWAEELIKQQAAYRCFCSLQRLEVLRQVQQNEKQPTKYDRACLNLTQKDIQEKLSAGTPFTIRLKIPPGQTIFKDLIRGQIKIDNFSLEDTILLKSDGYPTYHLANVIDDHEMKITHVIRGEEWLPSTPKHLLIYAGFGWQPPEFAHLPNVLNIHKAKLSKRRDGEAVWVQTYKKEGYLPQALLNFLAFLGWHPKDNREIFNLAELEKEFELERVQKAGAIFDIDKLNWFNAYYIRSLPSEQLDNLLQPYYAAIAGGSYLPVGKTLLLTKLLQDRLTTLNSVISQANWFFHPPAILNPELIIPVQSSAGKTARALKEAIHILKNINDWKIENIKNSLEVLIRPGTFSRRDLLWPMRVALTGEKESPDVFGVAMVLGQKECLARLEKAEKIINQTNVL